MPNERFQEMLKSKLDQLKENTLLTLISRDHEYQVLSTQLASAEEKYRSLNLSPEQKEFIDHFINTNDSCNMEYSTLSYLAGLIDGQKIGTLISPTSADANDSSEAIRNFYYRLFQPCAEQCESPQTIEFWKSLEKVEQTLAVTLTPEQSIIFEDISNKRTEGTGYSMADSFVYGFQLGTKMLQMLLD